MSIRQQDAVLRERFNLIAWDEPLRVAVLGEDGYGLACRYCIAHDGLKASEVNQHPQTYADFEEHLRMIHGRP